MEGTPGESSALQPQCTRPSKGRCTCNGYSHTVSRFREHTWMLWLFCLAFFCIISAGSCSRPTSTPHPHREPQEHTRWRRNFSACGPTWMLWLSCFAFLCIISAGNCSRPTSTPRPKSSSKSASSSMTWTCPEDRPISAEK